MVINGKLVGYLIRSFPSLRIFLTSSLVIIFLVASMVTTFSLMLMILKQQKQPTFNLFIHSNTIHLNQEIEAIDSLT